MKKLIYVILIISTTILSHANHAMSAPKLEVRMDSQWKAKAFNSTHNLKFEGDEVAIKYSNDTNSKFICFLVRRFYKPNTINHSTTDDIINNVYFTRGQDDKSIKRQYYINFHNSQNLPIGRIYDAIYSWHYPETRSPSNRRRIFNFPTTTQSKVNEKATLQARTRTGNVLIIFTNSSSDPTDDKWRSPYEKIEITIIEPTPIISKSITLRNTDPMKPSL